MREHLPPCPLTTLGHARRCCFAGVSMTLIRRKSLNSQHPSIFHVAITASAPVVCCTLRNVCLRTEDVTQHITVSPRRPKAHDCDNDILCFRYSTAKDTFVRLLSSLVVVYALLRLIMQSDRKQKSLFHFITR